MVDDNEQCDPPDNENCTADCQIPVVTCGTGAIDAGEECNGGPTLCNCTSINVYLHVNDRSLLLWMRNATIPGCLTDNRCEESGSYTFGAVLCCN